MQVAARVEIAYLMNQGKIEETRAWLSFKVSGRKREGCVDAMCITKRSFRALRIPQAMRPMQCHPAVVQDEGSRISGLRLERC